MAYDTLVVGLGNPGPKHRGQRHNVGFMALDAVHAGPYRKVARFRGELAEARLAERRVLLLRPLTFMNLSGDSVGPTARFHRIEPEAIVVIHDDMDLAFGRLKVKQGGGDGGQRGVRSIIQHLGANFVRIRIGIGRPSAGSTAVPHVLSTFGAQEKQELDKMLGLACDALTCVLQEGVATAMNSFNGG